MKAIYLAIALICAALSQAHGKTITMNTVATSCVAQDAYTTATEYNECYAQLIFKAAANANNTYLFSAALTYYGNGQVIGQFSVGTYEPFIYPDGGGCSEICFTYTSDASANLVSFRFYTAYNGCWYCSMGAFDRSGAGENYFSSDTAIEMFSEWSFDAPAPVPLTPAVLLLVSAILSLFCLGYIRKRGLA